ncbi:glutamate racemase [Paenibacillus radicibacter]|uniref:glutamate racemase n=1 Tax=Paenibacillus radicibacter TaxID=2972488 RepID=UPI00280BE741|nr:glutamate racemase [Paenibacillus radicibacter]
MQQAIAILDSGVGGLTVVKEVMRQLPQEKIIYFGDTARAPYGPRQPEEVKLFTTQIVDYLMRFSPKMIVIACNTATAVALDDIRKRVSIPVLGVIGPGARAAIKATRSGTIGIIGTVGTIRSGAYERALKSIAPGTTVYSHACPQLVPIVESGHFEGPATLQIVKDSLQELRNKPIDCLVLGCTHYPFLSEQIRKVMGKKVLLISSADETASEISTVLNHRRYLAKNDETPVHRFFCSGEPALFKKITTNWLKEQIQDTPVVWQVPNFR